MIKALELYLVTNNNGLEEVDFYKDVFDAEVVSCTTFGQAIPDTPEENKDLFEKLADGAQAIDMELQETPWSPAYGIVVDKFGMTWQVNTDIPEFVSETVNF
ncbi:hypothetical protein GRB29_06030 [Streptococcus pneumoniae]|nr:hypothetical protein [Streptococcus pneumoniae]